MPCELFAQKCSIIVKKPKYQNVRGPPEYSAIGNIIGIFGYWLLWHYNMSFKTIAGGFNGAFWWYGPLSEDREKFNKCTKTILWR